eukprot:TRINITY_DN1455_c0_g1_i1.p1 TRINITY_DN1455_c0_g1~~TRINITY_DN1455_c0_g1_i1.p1  ORF type:complete len:111 (-),score=4.44 TRINITY_DN1455_c0_g1_i1:19-351(-)
MPSSSSNNSARTTRRSSGASMPILMDPFPVRITFTRMSSPIRIPSANFRVKTSIVVTPFVYSKTCLLYTSDAADDLLCVDLGGRRIIKKKKTINRSIIHTTYNIIRIIYI